MSQWKKLGSKEVKVGYKTAVIKKYEMPDGKIEEYTTWDKVGTQCIATVAITKDNKVVVARQFRPGPEIMFDDIPGGAANPGEKLEDAARRELREETGYQTKGLFKQLGTVCKDAYTNATHNYFLALDCEPTSTQDLDDNEHIEIVLITLEKLLENARTAKMSDSVAVLLAIKELQEIKNAEKSH